MGLESKIQVLGSPEKQPIPDTGSKIRISNTAFKVKRCKAGFKGPQNTMQSVKIQNDSMTYRFNSARKLSLKKMLGI
jgi:hypothetical protein